MCLWLYDSVVCHLLRVVRQVFSFVSQNYCSSQFSFILNLSCEINERRVRYFSQVLKATLNALFKLTWGGDNNNISICGVNDQCTPIFTLGSMDPSPSDLSAN